MEEALSSEMRALCEALKSSVLPAQAVEECDDYLDGQPPLVGEVPATEDLCSNVLDLVSQAQAVLAGNPSDLTKAIAATSTAIINTSSLDLQLNPPQPAQPQKKRGPGRPSKTPAAPPIRHDGIVTEPRNQDDRLEVSSANPQMFKSLFNYFEKLKCDEIHIHATPTGLNFYSEDAKKDLKVRASIAGEQMNWYYCADEFWLSLNLGTVKGLTSKIDKSFHVVKFVYRYSDAMVFEMILQNRTAKIDHHWPLTVGIPTPRPEWVDLEKVTTSIDEYPLAWTIDAKSFKKTHDIAKLHATTIRIEIVGGTDRLKLSYAGSGIPTFSEEYTDSKQINLLNNLEEDEIFSVDYSASSGTTLSGAIPSDHVRIFCKEDSPILFLSNEEGISLITSMDVVA